MNVEVRADIVLKKVPEIGYRQQESSETICTIIVKGYSTKDVEEKLGKIQQACTHEGWEIVNPEKVPF